MDTTENQTSVPPTPMPASPAPKKDPMAAGPIAVIVIIIGLLAIGAWYFMSQNLGNLSSDAPATTVEGLQGSDDPAVQAALSQGSSDDLSSIEADVTATDFSGVDESAAAIDAEAQ